MAPRWQKTKTSVARKIWMMMCKHIEPGESLRVTALADMMCQSNLKDPTRWLKRILQLFPADPNNSKRRRYIDEDFYKAKGEGGWMYIYRRREDGDIEKEKREREELLETVQEISYGPGQTAESRPRVIWSTTDTTRQHLPSTNSWASIRSQLYPDQHDDGGKAEDPDTGPEQG